MGTNKKECLINEHIAVHTGHVVGVLLLKDADNGEGDAVDGDLLTHGVNVVEEGVGDFGAEDTDLAVVFHVQEGDVPAPGDGEVVAQGVVLVAHDELGGFVPVAVIAVHGLGAVLQDSLVVVVHGGSEAQDVVVEILHAVVPDGLGQIPPGGAVGIDVDHVVAQALVVLPHLAVLALGVGDQDDDGGQADDDAQHGEGGAGLFRGDRFDRDLEGLGQVQRKAPSLSPS